MKKIIVLVSLLSFITLNSYSSRVSRVATSNESRVNLTNTENITNNKTSRVARSSVIADKSRSSIISVSDNDKRINSVIRTSRNASSKFVPKVARTATKNSSISSPSITRSIKISRFGITSGRTSKLMNNSLGRSAKKSVDISRSGVRATKVFDDVSKIGGGYEKCRNAYNTCMDQFCAKSNDTFRRCYCSDKVQEFKETEAVFDKVKSMLQSFQDNNLNAINKTAAEVDAMYSATAGENAIKKDTSGAAAILDEIGDLLSGKKKLSSESSNKKTSLDLSSDMENIWSGDNDFLSNNGDSSVKDLTSLEGESLYKASEKQCYQVIKGECENETVLSMVRSSYTILMANDCNLYEKKLSSKKLSVANTVREAEKKLREARLEEYKAHNSQDINECVSKVKTAITSSNEACGKDYQACLDPTGLYINKTNGEPVYSPHLFKLTEVINLYSGGNNGVGTVLSNNENFSKFLDEKKIFVERALDSCRDKADKVWTVFKESAIIEIAQAQDKKIEEVKGKCVLTMKECYDTVSGGLAKFDDTTAQQTGALQAFAARKMCQDKVAACAALYAGPNDKACEFDNQGKLTTPDCGMKALLAFVQTVDNVKVAEGCEKGLRSYIDSICGKKVKGADGMPKINLNDLEAYPYKCRNKIKGTPEEEAGAGMDKSLYANLKQFAIDNCLDPSETDKKYEKLDQRVIDVINESMKDISGYMDFVLMQKCENKAGEDGYWAHSEEGEILPNFITEVFNGKENTSWGKCLKNNTKLLCLANNSTDDPERKDIAEYKANLDECSFKDIWFKERCDFLGGYFENGTCYGL